MVLTYIACRAFDNFGLDPRALLDALGARERALGALGLAPAAALEPWPTAALIAWTVNQVAELVRLPAAVAGAPRLRRAVEARRARALK